MTDNKTEVPILCDLDAPGDELMRLAQVRVLPGFFLAVFILGLPLNLLSLWIPCRHLGRRNRSAIFLLNLAIADTCWLLALPSLIQYHLSGLNWSLGLILCRTVRFLYHCYFYVSIAFVTCVSFDRYLVIVHPLHSATLLTHRHSSLLCLVIWLFSLVQSLPSFFLSVTQHCHQNNRTLCAIYVFLPEWRWSLAYSVAATCVSFLLPFGAITYCCLRSAAELRRRRGLRPRLRRLTRVLSAIMLFFGLMYLPYHLSRNWAILMRALFPQTRSSWQLADAIFTLDMAVCSLSSCINPLFSCCIGPHFKREFQDAVAGILEQCRKGTRNTVMPFRERDKHEETSGNSNECRTCDQIQAS
ncbi:P2Y purinoceptor 6-like [Chanos chanos]|uniref:P2Y purinoceptor 6-like n=1 Tax=Chanos chanos TaxID=29144 RepID=A0A6J2WPU2_CHACN|nr:P2Y purinoceptor 6-like [Chanos chanos]